MDVIIVVMVFLFMLAIIHELRLRFTKRKNLPPGPTPIPIIGNLHLLGDLPHRSLTDLAKTYGPIMCLRFGQITTVVISSAAMAKEVLQKQDKIFSFNRTILDTMYPLEHYKYSVIFLPASEKWRSLRKIMNSHIFSSKRLEFNHELRSRKVEELIVYCRKNSESNEAVDIGHAAFRTSLNMLSGCFFSFDVVDIFQDSTNEFEDLVRKVAENSGKPNVSDFFPILRKVDLQNIRRRTTFFSTKLVELFSHIITERLEQHKTQNDANNDVLDLLLTTSRESPDEMDKNQVEHLFADLFVAGTDTMSRTVEWAMAEAFRNPQIMNKAKAELEKITGKGKIVTEADIPRLPYLQNMVKETLRLHPPAPFLIPRKVDQDVELCSDKIPKNSQVLVNAWAIGRDEEVWENPWEFKPERFLDCDVNFKGCNFELIPFGAGRRICPGLTLAEWMVTVMVGSLLNVFDWKLEGGMKPEHLNMEETFGIVVRRTNPLRAIPTLL